VIVVVTGGRTYADRDTVDRVLTGIDDADARGITALCQGGARGADTLAFQWGLTHRVPQSLTYTANWQKHGFSAGPKRNRWMLTEAARMAEEAADEVVVVAFPGGKGTADCVKQARAMGLAVREVA